MATSYANEGGTGHRNSQIVVTATSGMPHGDINNIVDGDKTANFWWLNSGAVSGNFINFDFGDTSYVIDEAIFYQQSATAQGTWQWQGSNDGTTWTNIGSTFAISSATQTITALNGNTTAYKQYKMLGVSGSTSSSPFVYEMEFKISTPQNRFNGTGYLNTGGSGNRTGIITVATGGGIPLGIVDPSGASTCDGSFADNKTYISNDVSPGAFLSYDFGSAKLIDEICVYFNGATYGTWKWQGSNDNSTWSDVGSSFTLLGGGQPEPIKLTSLNGNTVSYRYVRMISISGHLYNGGGNLEEMEFRIAAGAAGGSLLISKGMDGGMHPQIKGGLNG